MTDQQTQIGRYRVIGSNGFGTVYLGSDPAAPAGADPQVSITVLADADAAARARLQAQAAALARTVSPNCVRVLDVIDQDSTVAIVSEFVAGALAAAGDHRQRPVARATSAGGA